MGKITADMIEDWEKESLIDAIGNCLELNDLFLERYCNSVEPETRTNKE